MEKLLSLIFYTKCTLCRKPGIGVCTLCLLNMPLATTSVCPVCLMPSIEGKLHLSCYAVHVPYTVFFAYEFSGSIKTVLTKHLEQFYALKVVAHRACDYGATVGYLYSEHVVLYQSIASKDNPVCPNSVVAQTVAKHFRLKCLEFKESTNIDSLRGKSVLVVFASLESRAQLADLVAKLYQKGVGMINCFVLVKKVI